MHADAPPVVVVGSLNLDVVMRVDRLPNPGETVLANDHWRNPGGKGANQAVAAARLGQSVAMVGRVGRDEAGVDLRRSLEDHGVDVSHVKIDDGAPTGVATIAVDHEGENSIIVGPGANGRVSPEDVRDASRLLDTAAVVLLQLEIPLDSVLAAAQAASGTVMLNPAPGRPLPRDLLQEIDVLVPNRGELSLLAGRPDSGGEILELVARIPGPETIVVTMGADGALVYEHGRATTIPSLETDVVDTTAAGDSFCGALADAMVRGQPLASAARWAAAAAAVTVSRAGAQPSLPTRGEVESVIESSRA
ncbi:MAG: ribokinase [Actinomycetota bacterium]|nr:ribokinase [Actinomycetota bacterium]